MSTTELKKMIKDAVEFGYDKSPYQKLGQALEIALDALEKIRSGLSDKGPRVLADEALAKSEAVAKGNI